MVQQLSLMASIGDDDFELFKTSMTILTGSPAVVFADITTVWKPDPRYNIDNVNSKNELVEPTRLKTSTNLPLEMIVPDEKYKKNGVSCEPIFEKLKDGEPPIDASDIYKLVEEPENKTVSWTLTTADIPAAGNNRKVTMQAIQESTILQQSGKEPALKSFMQQLGYAMDYIYITVGVRFTHRHDLFIHCQKVWDIRQSRIKEVTKGGFLVNAFVNVRRATDIERLNHAETSLLALQKDVSGYVEFSVPDRKSMDLRMHNMPKI
ncbi:Mediator of RNA polymerase II transcription subunit 18 [Nakaseomyces bracarensis]|uniref:Mediator of RNA polymerase II transcription subunit 18 n=1 Tax=Nakaseomyces bracarensis TaxID=273131 RepID=A0ABR4NUH5_9SACH